MGQGASGKGCAHREHGAPSCSTHRSAGVSWEALLEPWLGWLACSGVPPPPCAPQRTGWTSHLRPPPQAPPTDLRPHSHVATGALGGVIPVGRSWNLCRKLHVNTGRAGHGASSGLQAVPPQCFRNSMRTQHMLHSNLFLKYAFESKIFTLQHTEQ